MFNLIVKCHDGFFKFVLLPMMWTSWSRQVEVCLLSPWRPPGDGAPDVGERIEGERKKVEGGRKQPFYRDI